MRTAPPAVLLSVLVPLAVVALPVVSLPHATAHPVRAELRSQPLRGVALAGLGAGALRGSQRAAFRAVQGAGPAARQAVPTRPDVLVTRTGVASFDLLGVTWRPGGTADLTVLVRTHGATGWTGWTALDAADAPGPGEARTARPGTEPLWVGDSDGYQVRVDVRRGTLPRGLRVDLVDPGSSAADSAVGAAPADAGRPGRDRAAAHPEPGPVGRRRVDPAQRPEVQRHHQGRLRAPHGRHQQLLRRGRPQDPARHLRLPRQGQRLVRHRLQLPRRPVRPAVGGPLRGDHQGGAGRAHGRVQRRHLRRVGDRQLRQGRRAGGDGRLDRPADGVEALAVVPGPQRHDRADLPGWRHVQVPGRHQGHLPGRLRAPGRRQHLLPGKQPVRAAADDPGLDDGVPRDRPARPAPVAGQCRLRPRRQHQHRLAGDQRPAVEPRGAPGL